MWPNAGIAQLVEHDLAKVGVAGSSPVSRSKSDVLTSDFFYFPPSHFRLFTRYYHMEMWIILLLILLAIWGWGHSLYWKGNMEKLQKDFEKQVEERVNLQIPMIRKQAIAQSRAVRSGQVSEQWLPFFPDFPFNPSEARFLGAPVDMVVFDGIDDPETPVHVHFLEIKTAKSNLSQRQKRIREAIENGRVHWKEIRLMPHGFERTNESQGRV